VSHGRRYSRVAEAANTQKDSVGQFKEAIVMFIALAKLCWVHATQSLKFLEIGISMSAVQVRVGCSINDMSE